MKKFIPAFAIVAALGATAAAQDRTTTTKIKVDGDDVKTVVMRGCLVRYSAGVFQLTGAIAAVGNDDLKAETRTKTDVDDHGTTVKEKSTTKIDDGDTKVVPTGPRTTYEVVPSGSLDLLPYIGQRVEIAALIPKNGEDAKVKIKEETKVDREHAPDSKSTTETKARIPRGADARLTAVAVKQIAPSCLP